jgi:hypothetical protein
MISGRCETMARPQKKCGENLPREQTLVINNLKEKNDEWMGEKK